MPHAGVPGDGQVCQSAFDVITDPAVLSAAWAADGHRDRRAVQVGDVVGVGDGQAQLGRTADRVGDEVRNSCGCDGSVRHGPWSDGVDA